MAIQPLGAPQPVKLATAPLAAAREVVRLTQEQNQRIRESRLEVDEEAARQARRAEESAREAAQDQARQDTATETAQPGSAQPGSTQPAATPTAAAETSRPGTEAVQTETTGGQGRGETVDILA